MCSSALCAVVNQKTMLSKPKTPFGLLRRPLARHRLLILSQQAVQQWSPNLWTVQHRQTNLLRRVKHSQGETKGCMLYEPRWRRYSLHTWIITFPHWRTLLSKSSSAFVLATTIDFVYFVSTWSKYITKCLRIKEVFKTYFGLFLLCCRYVKIIFQGYISSFLCLCQRGETDETGQLSAHNGP